MARAIADVENWDRWADGEEHILVVGTDTPPTTVNGFRKRAYSAAARPRELRAEVHELTEKDMRGLDEVTVNGSNVEALLASGSQLLTLQMHPADD